LQGTNLTPELRVGRKIAVMTESLLQECEKNRDDDTCLEAFAHADEEDLVRRGLSALPLIGQGWVNGRGSSLGMEKRATILNVGMRMEEKPLW